MGTKRQNGDGDGDKVSVFADGLDDPKGIVFAGGKLITADFDKVWSIDAKGVKTLLAGPDSFPKPPLFLNDVVVEHGGKSILITEMGDLKAVLAPDGSFWPFDGGTKGCEPFLFAAFRLDVPDVAGPDLGQIKVAGVVMRDAIAAAMDAADGAPFSRLPFQLGDRGQGSRRTGSGLGRGTGATHGSALHPPHAGGMLAGTDESLRRSFLILHLLS